MKDEFRAPTFIMLVVTANLFGSVLGLHRPSGSFGSLKLTELRLQPIVSLLVTPPMILVL